MILLDHLGINKILPRRQADRQGELGSIAVKDAAAHTQELTTVLKVIQLGVIGQMEERQPAPQAAQRTKQDGPNKPDAIVFRAFLHGQPSVLPCVGDGGDRPLHLVDACQGNLARDDSTP